MNETIHKCISGVWSSLGEASGAELVSQPDTADPFWETSIGIRFVESGESVVFPVDFEIQSTDYPDTPPKYLAAIWWLSEDIKDIQLALDVIDGYNGEPGIKLRIEDAPDEPAALVLQAELPLRLLEESEPVFTAMLGEAVERLVAFVEEHYQQIIKDLIPLGK